MRPRRLLLVLAIGLVGTAACDPEADVALTLGGTTADVRINHVAIDSTGATIVGGAFAGRLELGDGPAVESSLQLDGFFAKLDPDGDVVWSRTFHGVQPYPSDGDDWVTGLAVMADDSVVVTGSAEGPIDVGGGPIGDDGDDYRDPARPFVARYAADGTHLWSQRWRSWDTFGESAALAPVIAADGSIYVTAAFTDAAIINGGTLDVGSEPVIVKLGADGTLAWAHPLRPVSVDAPGSYWINGLVASDDGELVVSGSLTGAVELGTGPLLGLDGYGTFVARVAAADGRVVSARAYTPAETPDGVRGLRRAPDGGLVLDGPAVTWLRDDLSIARAVDLGELGSGKVVFRRTGEAIWQSPSAYVRIGADGRELSREVLPPSTAQDADLELTNVAVGPNDRVALVGWVRGSFELADRAVSTTGPWYGSFLLWLP